MHTHAQRIVQAFVTEQLCSIHGARQPSWCKAVLAIIEGQRLSLSRLARSMMGMGTLKAAIKRVDRLIGHEARVKREAQIIGLALLRMLCQGRDCLVIAVDWSALTPGGTFVELRASLVHAGMGRGLNIYHQVYPEAKLGNARCERSLLRTLQKWIPAHQQVVIVSDAGFRRPWFEQVERMGWMWVGRVRSGVHVSRDARTWQDAAGWFTQARGKAQRWIDCGLSKRHHFNCDMILVRRHNMGRKDYERAGHGATAKAKREAQKSAREPWLLAHDRRLRGYAAEQIVAWYGRRMQIEENFRDHKSQEFGMALSSSQSRRHTRLLALLLIGSLAAYILWHIGQLAEVEGLHQRFKATTRKARELSLVTLGRLMCAQHFFGFTTAALKTINQRLGIQV
jgi:hypothetical protein